MSKTPGRTQQLNFFDLGEGRYLVDLPGYGYAKASKGEQAQWETFLPTYLRSREVLRGLVLIMDIRHPFTELDALLMGLFAPTGKPVHVLLTKADKLSRSAALAALREVECALTSGAAFASCQLFSSVSKEGVDDARSSLEKWLRLDTLAQPTAE